MTSNTHDSGAGFLPCRDTRIRIALAYQQSFSRAQVADLIARSFASALATGAAVARAEMTEIMLDNMARPAPLVRAQPAAAAERDVLIHAHRRWVQENAPPTTYTGGPAPCWDCGAELVLVPGSTVQTVPCPCPPRGRQVMVPNVSLRYVRTAAGLVWRDPA
jgi:hypothetical protein